MADFIIGRVWRRCDPARAIEAARQHAARALGWGLWVYSASAAGCVGPVAAPAAHMVLALVTGEAGAW